MSLNPVFTGAHMLDDALTAVDVWQLLHSDAKEWDTTPRNSKFFKIREMLDQADYEALKKLREFPATSWEHLCFGAGWTVYGAVGLSWCEGADFAKVSDCWLHSGFELNTQESSLRAARLINPDVLPKAVKLSALVDELENNSFRISLALAARGGKIKVDLPPQSLEPAPVQLVPFLVLAIETASVEAEYEGVLGKWRKSL